MAIDPELITKWEADVIALGRVVNDAVGTANPGHPSGTVTTRLGGVVKNLAQTMRDASGRVGLQYTLAGGINTTVNPGQGNVVINAADAADVTEMAVSALDYLGLSFAEFIAGWDRSTTLLNRGYVVVQKLDGSGARIWRIVGATVVGVGFYRLRVSNVSGAGVFAVGDAIALLFVPTGDRGGNNYVISGSFPGDALPAGGEALLRHYFETAVLFPANFPGWNISSKVAAPEVAVYVVRSFTGINDAVGTVRVTGTLALGAKVATFSAAEYTAPAGSYLEVRAPDPPVAGLLDVNVTVVGTQVVI